jgi:site-specific recombinase XerD
MSKQEAIKPLFTTTNYVNNLGKITIALAVDNYNKKDGTALIHAKTDPEAITAFLNEYKESPATIKSYAKEIERLLLWCIHIGKVNISSIKRDHLLDYQKFLKSPSPKKLWCGPCVSRLSKDGTLNPKWRPFVAGLSGSSINKAIKILDSFFNYLVLTNYLSGNPMAVDKRRKRRNNTKLKIVDRYLELDEIHATLDALSEAKDWRHINPYQVIRARYIILLLFFTGLRISEAASHSMGNFIQRENNWFLRIIGKGKKLREIPIPDELLNALAEFRHQAGLPSSRPKFREKTPLIPMENLKQPISSRRVDQIIRWAFNLGAARFEPQEPRKASKLRQASAHWLRHSYVTYLLEAGASLKVAQENAGHSDISTTMHYCHVAQTDRHAATQQLSLVKRKI